jgi:hypothetical protein
MWKCCCRQLAQRGSLIRSAIRVTQQCWALYRSVPFTPPTPQMVINKFLSNKRGDLNTRSTVVLPIRMLTVVAHYAGFRTKLCSLLVSSAQFGPGLKKIGWWGSFLSAWRSKDIQPLFYVFFALSALCHFTPLNLRSLIFSFTPFGWLRFITLNPLLLMGMSFFIDARSFSNATRA